MWIAVVLYIVGAGAIIAAAVIPGDQGLWLTFPGIVTEAVGFVILVLWHRNRDRSRARKQRGRT